MNLKFNNLKAENERYYTILRYISEIRQNAITYEKQNDIENALSSYYQCIEIAEKEKKTNIANFAHDIERISMIYSKQKKFIEAYQILEKYINLYPNFHYSKAWIERVEKLKSRIKI